MRVLILNWKDLTHPLAGGAEVYVEQLARHWVRDGHEVTLFCAAVDGQAETEVIDGVRIIRRGSRLGVYREARRFYEREGRGRFDVVLDGVNTRPFLTTRYVDDAPVVALIHQLCREIWWYEAPIPVAVIGRFWLERRWLKDYRDVPVLTVSESSRASLAGYGLRNLTVVPEGVEVAPRPEVTKEVRPTVAFVGRLSANKRPLHALKAFELLQREVPDAQLWIVGAGPQEKRLRRRAGKGVTLFGRVSEEERNELLARAHVLVATSVREGWGLVVDEAIAMGTPTVAYDAPGLRDSVTAAGGVLVAQTPAALAAGVAAQLLVARAPAASGGAVGWDQVAAVVMDRLDAAW